MLPKLENKTQTGTIVHIVPLIINCSTIRVQYIYSVQQNKAYARLNIARQQSSCRAAVWHGTEHVSDGYRVQYSINAFMSVFYFEKSC